MGQICTFHLLPLWGGQRSERLVQTEVSASRDKSVTLFVSPRPWCSVEHLSQFLHAEKWINWVFLWGLWECCWMLWMFSFTSHLKMNPFKIPVESAKLTRTKDFPVATGQTTSADAKVLSKNPKVFTNHLRSEGYILHFLVYWLFLLHFLWPQCFQVSGLLTLVLSGQVFSSACWSSSYLAEQLHFYHQGFCIISTFLRPADERGQLRFVNVVFVSLGSVLLPKQKHQTRTK